MQYRRILGSDVWHWRKDCQHWTKRRAFCINNHSKPYDGEFCNECLSKERLAKSRGNAKAKKKPCR